MFNNKICGDNSLLIIIITIIIVIFMFKNINEKFKKEYTYDDINNIINEMDSLFTRYPKYSSLGKDSDYKQAKYYLKVLHDLYISLKFKENNRRDKLYCVLPPDTKELCRGFKKDFTLLDKLEYVVNYCKKIFRNKLNVLYKQNNNKRVLEISEIINDILDYLKQKILEIN